MVSGKAQERPFSSVPTHPIQLLMAAARQLPSTLNVSPSTTGTLLGFLGEFLGRMRPTWAGKTMVSHVMEGGLAKLQAASQWAFLLTHPGEGSCVPSEEKIRW